MSNKIKKCNKDTKHRFVSSENYYSCTVCSEVSYTRRLNESKSY